MILYGNVDSGNFMNDLEMAISWQRFKARFFVVFKITFPNILNQIYILRRYVFEVERCLLSKKVSGLDISFNSKHLSKQLTCSFSLLTFISDFEMNLNLRCKTDLVKLYRRYQNCP